MSLPITEQEYQQAQRNLEALTNALNNDGIVEPPIGSPYKSVPMVIREIQENGSQLLNQFDSDAGNKMLEIAALKEASVIAADRAELAANSGGLTTPTPITSANLAILTGVYYTKGDVPTEEQYKIDVIKTDTQIIQTATKGDGVIWTRSAVAGDLSDAKWRNTVEANYIDDVQGLAAFVGYENQIIQTKEYHDGTGYGGATYKFNPARIAENNGISVINGWVLQSEKALTVCGFKLSQDHDNTSALQNLLNFAATSEDNNFIVDGVFYFKTGNCSRNIGGKSIKLAGAGRDVSKLIFEKEDQTGTSYVNETQANVIARIFNADIITLSGVKVQGITDLANPGGAATNVDAVYIWQSVGFCI